MGNRAFHLWGQQPAWLQGKEAKTSVSWAAAILNEWPLSCWGQGRVFRKPYKSGSPGDGKKPSHQQTQEATNNGKKYGGGGSGGKGPRLSMELSVAED